MLRQFASEPTAILLVALTFTAASLVPLFSAPKDTPAPSFGPFTPAAEMLNSRAAMIGFASLLVVEGIRGAALF